MWSMWWFPGSTTPQCEANKQILDAYRLTPVRFSVAVNTEDTIGNHWRFTKRDG